MDATPELEQIALHFNMKMYSYGALLQAAKDFREHFEVALDGNPKEMVKVTIGQKSPAENTPNIEMVGKEFYNYTLGLMQSGGK